MIDLGKFIKDVEEEGKKLTRLSAFKCEYCDQNFHEDALTIAIQLYGIFFLVGEKDGFAGFNCPKCLKTLLLKGDIAQINFFHTVIEKLTIHFETGGMAMILQYQSSFHFRLLYLVFYLLFQIFLPEREIY